MCRIARDKRLSDLRRETAAIGHPIIVADLIGGIVHMCHPNWRQRASAHQEMPSAGVVPVVVDGVVPPLSQHLAKLLRNSRKVGASVAHIMDLRSQPARLLIEDPWLAAGGQEINSANIAFGPEPQYFHEPGLGTAHA